MVESPAPTVLMTLTGAVRAWIACELVTARIPSTPSEAIHAVDAPAV